MKIDSIRKDFPILSRKINGKPLVYLDSAATSQRPRQVFRAIEEFYTKHNANVNRGIHTLTVEATEEYDKARKKIAEFVGIYDLSELIFVRNTDEAINLVAYSWGAQNIKRGDEIVLTIAEHHANFVPWQQLAKKVGAKLIVVSVDDNGEIDLAELKKVLNAKTKMVTFFHVSNVLGTIAPVEQIVKLVRKEATGAVILIDGAQSVPHLPVDISKLGCDFYAFSAHKMLGPTGIGVLWGRRELLETMSPFLFGGDMISQVSVEKSKWGDLPYKFEAGTPYIEGAIGMAAGVDYLAKIGMDNVRKHELELTKYTMGILSRIEGIKIIGPKQAKKRCGVIAFKLGDVPVHDIASILDGEGVAIRSGYNCAEPLAHFLKTGPLARVSFYIYNTKAEVDRFIEGVEKVKKIFSMKGK